MISPDVVVVDIRPQELRWKDPLETLIPNEILVSSLEKIEKGGHGITGRVVVVCEIGVRSRVAAMYLLADGVEATHLPGGVKGLKLALRS
ncbi:rhodanese-like domain-containing protein [Deinococcus yavapaiensis]|uniref:rhodanese-like domain-containing protein n=1 Tax=Deinococcus yavapaiensis TaxID=309889 RepID=UPI000DA10A32|nr:rhodanese-like domain-containing protein [Deinococcus yavapaiensis]